MKALVVASAKPRISNYVQTLSHEGCEVVSADEAFDAFDLLRHHQFDIIVIDESLDNMLPLEFTLTLRDMRVHQPVAIIATPTQQNTFARLSGRVQAEFVGSPEDAMHFIPEAIRLAQNTVNGHSTA